MNRLSRKRSSPDDGAGSSEEVEVLNLVYTPATHNPKISIIAIHGLETTSPRTWVYRDERKGISTNWLEDDDMLRKAVPDAVIYTYNWDANFANNSIQDSLQGHAKKFLDVLNTTLPTQTKTPIIFIASCFGGMLLAKALVYTKKDESPYRYILGATAGILFFGTPFRGSSAARLARWAASVNSIMRKEASKTLIGMLDEKSDPLDELTTEFSELMISPSRMPIVCYYETKETLVLRRFLPKGLNTILFWAMPKVILVDKMSARLAGHEFQHRAVKHILLNKFKGSDDIDYKRVVNVITKFADDAKNVIYNRSNAGRKCHDMIPYPRNDGFVGRANELEQLVESIAPLKSPDKCQVNAVVGLDGVGKTELALEAAHRLRQKDEDCSVFWVRSDSRDSLMGDYSRIGERLEVDDRPGDIVAKVTDRLRTRQGRWLLVFDGVDENEIFFEKWYRANWFPDNQHGSILLTMGNKNIAISLDLKFLTVSSMNEDESKALLSQGFSHSEEHGICEKTGKDTDELVRLLAGLPLAIKLASQYMRGERITVQEYIQRWKKSDREMIEKLCRPPTQQASERSRESSHAVATTWLITLASIQESNPDYLKCLKFIAMCGRTNIRIALIEENTDVEARKVIKDLMQYSFVTKPEVGADSIDVHPLVQLAMKHWLEDKKEWDTTAMLTIKGYVRSHPFPTEQTIGRWKADIRHMENVLDQTNDNAGYEQSVWQLLYAAGHARYLMHDRSKTKPLMQDDKTTNNQAPEWENVEKMKQVHKRALILEANKKFTTRDDAAQLRREGKYPEAKCIYTAAIQQEQETLGEDHPLVTENKRHLACTFLLERNYKEAIDLYRHALAAEERLLGQDHPSTITARESLAFTLKASGDYDGAIFEYQRTLKLKETIWGEMHPSTTASMDDLAMMYRRQGQHSQSEPLLLRAIKVKGKMYGENHPSTQASKRLLSIVHSRYERCDTKSLSKPASDSE